MSDTRSTVNEFFRRLGAITTLQLYEDTYVVGKAFGV